MPAVGKRELYDGNDTGEGELLWLIACASMICPLRRLHQRRFVSSGHEVTERPVVLLIGNPKDQDSKRKSSGMY